MKTIPARLRRWLFAVGQLSLLAGLILLVHPASGQNSPATTDATTNITEADKAWKEVKKASQPPTPPAEWQSQKPSREEVAKFYNAALLKAADKAKDFYVQYPNHPKAAEAHKIEYNLLNLAAQRFGDTSQTKRLEAIEAVRLKDPALSEDERFRLRLGAARRLVEDLPDSMDKFVKAAQDLQKDFPETR